jgi:hypothetical protein
LGSFGWGLEIGAFWGLGRHLIKYVGKGLGSGDGLGDSTVKFVTREVTRKGRGFCFGDGDSEIGVWKRLWISGERVGDLLGGWAVEKWDCDFGVILGRNVLNFSVYFAVSL